MFFYKIKKYDDKSIIVTCRKNGEVIRSQTIALGFTYEIQPDELRKKKNRGRKCIVIDYLNDHLNNPVRAKVLYVDSGRSGKVYLVDLVDVVKKKEDDNDVIRCRNCDKGITDKTEVEYSEELTSFFCNPNCATNYYYEYMRSVPLEGMLEFRSDIYFKDGRLYRKD